MYIYIYIAAVVGNRTLTVGEELDKPGVEADTVGWSEPDVLVGEAEASRREGVRLGESRQHRHVHQPLLQRHQQRHARHHQPSHAVQQHRRVRHHFRSLNHLSLSLSLSLSMWKWRDLRERLSGFYLFILMKWKGMRKWNKSGMVFWSDCYY